MSKLHLTLEDFQGLTADLGTATREAIERAVAPLRDRIAELEKRPAVKWRGVWSASRSYPEGSVITQYGSLWLATKDTAVRPGVDDSWRLIVKGQ